MALIIEFLVRWVFRGELDKIARIALLLRKEPATFFKELFAKPFETARQIANLPQQYKEQLVKIVNAPKNIVQEITKFRTFKGEAKKFVGKISPQGTKFVKGLGKHIETAQNEPRLGDLLGQLNATQRRTYGVQKATQNKYQDFAILSSSWVLDGFFSSVQDSDTGTLELEFKRAKHIYTYYNVPLSVWKSMKEARGRDGSGAGSVFWALFLRGYHLSFDSARLPELYKRAGIKENPVPNPKKLGGSKERVKLGRGISQRQVVLEAKAKWFYTRSQQNRKNLFANRKSTTQRNFTTPTHISKILRYKGA